MPKPKTPDHSNFGKAAEKPRLLQEKLHGDALDRVLARIREVTITKLTEKSGPNASLIACGSSDVVACATQYVIALIHMEEKVNETI